MKLAFQELLILVKVVFADTVKATANLADIGKSKYLVAVLQGADSFVFRQGANEGSDLVQRPLIQFRGCISEQLVICIDRPLKQALGLFECEVQCCSFIYQQLAGAIFFKFKTK